MSRPAVSSTRGVGTGVLWSVQVFARSCVVAFAQERMMHAWWTWLFLWMGRMVAEISFFALIGRLIGGDGSAVSFLLVGAAMLAPAYGTMFVASTVRGLVLDGLVPYMISSPARDFPVTLGRNVHWCLDGAIGGSLGLIVGNVVFDLGFGTGQVVALVLMVLFCPVVMVGSGLMVGNLATRFPDISNLLSSLARAVLGLFCGATFAVEYLPVWLRPISEILPLTHLIRAARDVVGGGSPWGHLALAVLVGGLWLLTSWYYIRTQFERSRRTGLMT
jgi:ABC-2 type transport system permease protein